MYRCTNIALLLLTNSYLASNNQPTKLILTHPGSDLSLDYDEYYLSIILLLLFLLLSSDFTVFTTEHSHNLDKLSNRHTPTERCTRHVYSSGMKKSGQSLLNFIETSVKKANILKVQHSEHFMSNFLQAIVL